MANEEVLGPRKTMFVLVIVVGCFAVLWPRILSPLLLGQSRDQLKPNQFDREAGCCEVLFETEVAVLEIINEVCGGIVQVNGKLSPYAAAECRRTVNETCGVDIAAFLKRDENVGKTTKKLLDTMKSSNSSCLKEHFGVSTWGVSSHQALNSWTLQDTMKQERPPMRAGPHPALRERGRAIPPGVPPAPTRGPVSMPPHVRVRSSPLEVYFQLDIKPPPIPGMRPPLGSPGGPVAAPKSSMGFVMPIYTICIIIFFVYTLSKIIFKRTGTTPYESISPDPQFRRRVFRGDSRTSPDKLVVNAISGLVAEVQQQMEASYAQNQQRQDLQDNHARPYTNGTVLHNSGPVHIVASEYREKSKEKSPEPVKDEPSEVREPAEPKESSPDSRDPLLDANKATLESVPEMKEPSPEPREPLPQPKEPTPELVEAIPQPKEPTPEPKEPSPEPKEPSPEPKEPIPIPKEPTPEPKESTLEPQEPTPEFKDPTLEHKELASALEESEFEPKEPASKPKELSSEFIETTDTNELTEQQQPKTEHNTQEHAPETKEPSSKLEDTNSEILTQKAEPTVELEEKAEIKANGHLIKLTENIDLDDDNKDSVVKSTEEFLSEEKQEVEAIPKQSTPELLEEALKEDSSEQESESGEPEEKGSVKVIGMELTAHTADGASPALPPLPAPAPAPAPAPRPHEAEEIKSIFLEGDIPQQSRVLVAEFEDRADPPAAARHSPMVVSGKMTLSLIQDAPRHTPDMDLESTLDDFTTASGVTQPAAEIEEELSDEEIEEEIEVEEIEEEVEESEEEIEEEIEEVPEKKVGQK